MIVDCVTTPVRAIDGATGVFGVAFFVPWIVLVAGALLAMTGAWWVWTGLDIVQIERGWSSVIAGATMLSAGLVIVAIAAILWRLDAILRRLAAGRVAAPAPAVAAAPAPIRQPADVIVSADEPQGFGDGEPHRTHDEGGGNEVIEQHVSGDTTYIMYADGSVDARTAEGTMRFESLGQLRAYADRAARESEDRG